MKFLENKAQYACACASARLCRIREEGQGTTEYAILVGVLAVIAMIAIAAFKDKIQGLWDAIKNGLGKL